MKHKEKVKNLESDKRILYKKRINNRYNFIIIYENLVSWRLMCHSLRLESTWRI